MIFLRYFSSSSGGGKLSFKQIDEAIDPVFIAVGLVIICGYLLSYFAFVNMRKIENVEIREIVFDFGKLGLGLVIVGHISFLFVYDVLNKVYKVTTNKDDLIHLGFIALMVFYVYICVKKFADISFK